MQNNPRKSRSRLRVRFRRRPFVPKEPAVVTGEFVGRQLSDLSDEELNTFLRVDARCQLRDATNLSAWFPHSYLDLSQCWFAKYELERRKPETQRAANTSLEIAKGDTKESIALKLIEYGYRAASRKFHPDHGGDNTIMQNLNAARQLARERLKVGERS
jgi:hypothetical protein